MGLPLDLSHPGGMRRCGPVDGVSGCLRLCSRKSYVLVSLSVCIHAEYGASGHWDNLSHGSCTMARAARRAIRWVSKGVKSMSEGESYSDGFDSGTVRSDPQVTSERIVLWLSRQGRVESWFRISNFRLKVFRQEHPYAAPSYSSTKETVSPSIIDDLI